MEYEVHEAVWLATAIMTLEVYEVKPDFNIDDISFKQSDIQKRAQFYTQKNVDHARVNQWNNADHSNHNYKYLRAVNKNRRITYIGEFNGEKECPKIDENELIPFENNPSKTISFGELIKFIGGEYKVYFSIRFNRITDHLMQYANLPYSDPQKATEERKDYLLQIKESGGNAVSELNKLANYFVKKYGFYNKNKSKWLTGGADVVRGYLWNQLKQENYLDIPTSISLFADKRKEAISVRYRISLELDEKYAKEADYERHHKCLKLEFKQDENYCYYVKFADEKDSVRTNLSRAEIINQVQSGAILKVQLVYELYSEEIKEKQLSNEQLLQKFDEAFAYLEDFYKLVIGDEYTVDKNTTDKEVKHELVSSHELNTILYGPPGTGKTYQTALHAVAIIEGRTIDSLKAESYVTVLKRYNKYKEAGQIAFTTFHQSYGYEEFIEGIKPVLDNSEQAELQYKIESGIFKQFCDDAMRLEVGADGIDIKGSQRIWKVSIGGSGLNWLKEECFEQSNIRIGWKDEGEIVDEYLNDSLYYFYEEMSIGDIVFSLGDQKHIDAIGIIKGDPEWITDVEYPRSRKVEWIAKNIYERIYEINGHKNLTQQTIYELSRISLAKANELILHYANSNGTKINKNEKKYVFIIDEINRGNISKILGELITLIEPSKRLGCSEELTVKLPYSKEEFGVPNNVYIIGTMNTADRSIALLDTALRRRFNFIEMLPDAEVLEGINIEGINIQEMLEVMNKRIEVLYDREHTIGHAYFVRLKDKPTLNALASIFENAIIPLLQEYFYEDYSKIQLVLGDNAKEPSHKFIQEQNIFSASIFKGNTDVYLAEQRFDIQYSALLKVESYLGIYE